MTVSIYFHHTHVDLVRETHAGHHEVLIKSGMGFVSHASLFFDSELDMANAALQMLDAARHIIQTRTILQVQADIADAKKLSDEPLADWERELLGLKNPE